MSIATAELCDRCSAPAKFTVILDNTAGVLSFCGHHHTKYEIKLQQIGVQTFEYGETGTSLVKKVGTFVTPPVPEDASAEYNPEP